MGKLSNTSQAGGRRGVAVPELEVVSSSACADASGGPRISPKGMPHKKMEGYLGKIN